MTPGKLARRILDLITARVPYFGRSTSPALVRVEDDAVPQTSDVVWRPLSNGVDTPLRCPRTGYLEALERAHHAGMSAFEVPAAEVEYTTSPEASKTMQPQRYESTLLVKQFSRVIDGRRLPEITTLFRRAFLARLNEHLHENEQPASLCGHANFGETEWVQVMFLGLLNVGARHADGTLKGVAMALPSGLDRRLRIAALTSWRDVTALTLGSRGVTALTDVVGDSIWTLRSSRWTRASTRFATATPIVPSRYCSSDTQRRRYVEECCADAGLPTPAVEILRHNPISGALRIGLRSTTRRPGELARPNFHARIVFGENVHGPLVLGDLRHYGLGLFAPESVPEPVPGTASVSAGSS